MSKYHLRLTGYVGGNDFNRRTVSRVLQEQSENEVSVLIDSTGGDLATGFSIAAGFKDHGAVTCHLVGFNASAATVAAMGASVITMDRNAMFLVHRCSNMVFAWDSMNAEEMQAFIENLLKDRNNLNAVDENIAAMYAVRCSRPKEELYALMKEERWLSAEEALSWGFIDKITDYPEDSKTKVTNSLIADFRAGGLPVAGMPAGEEDRSASRFGDLIETIINFFTGSRRNRIQVPANDAAEASESEETTDSVENSGDTEVSAEETESAEETAEEETEETINVVDTPDNFDTSAMAGFFNTGRSARDLYNSIP